MNKIETFLELIRCAFPIEYARYDMQGHLLEPVRMTHFLDDLFVRRHLSFLNAHPFQIVILGDRAGLLWVGINDQKHNYLLGPVLERRVSLTELHENIYDVTEEVRNIIIDTVLQLPVMPKSTLLQYALMFYHAVTNEKTEFSQILFESEALSEDINADFSESEENMKNCWICETKLYDAVKNGQGKQMKQLISQFSSLATRTLVSANAVRNKQVLSLISLALCVKASVEGGLSISTAFALEAHYADQIEKAADLSALSYLNLAMYEDFASRVSRLKKIRENHSDFLTELEEYLQLNIEEDLSLEHIAKEFNYTPYYLSRKYKEEKGMTLFHFLKELRLNRSLMYLENTSISISEISGKLHFSSVSHFIREFKAMFGKTPAAYRKEKWKQK